jgi:hypothetical protein
MLCTLQGVHEEQTDRIEHQHGAGVGLPAHLFCRIDTRQAIDGALASAEDSLQSAGLALEHASHERAQRLDQQHQDHKIKCQLEPDVGIHENHSGRSKATNR